MKIWRLYAKADLAKIDNFHRNQIDVAHRTSKNKMASIIVLFHKKSDRQNFYFQKKKISKVHVKLSMEEDNACETFNGDNQMQNRVSM